MSKEFYVDSNEIKRWEETPEGYLRIWLTFGVPDQNMEYVTDSGRRVEYIEKDDLIDPKSLSTLIGKPLALNHPPKPIVNSNFGEYSKGFTLQHIVDTEDGIPVISAVVYDPDVASKIKTKEIKKTSSGYWALKTPQSDGRIKQSDREYNHIALLTNEFEPRAGSKSEIVLDSIQAPKKEEKTMTTNKKETEKETPKESLETENKTNETPNTDSNNQVLAAITDLTKEIKTLIGVQKAVTTDAKEPVKEPEKESNDDSVQARTELWAEWKETLDKHNKTIDYSLDSDGIKRLVLSCFYDESDLKEINQDASLLKGFWIGFKKLNSDSKKKSETTNQDSNSKTQNSDSGETDYEAEFIRLTTQKAK